MRLENRTKWNGEDLRRLLGQVLIRAGVGTENYLVIVNYSRGGNYTGLGWYHRREILVRVPSPQHRASVVGSDGRLSYATQGREFNPEIFARVATHEIDHNRGLDHKVMVKSYQIDCSWAKSFVVKPTKKKTVVKEDIKAKRYRRTLELITDKEGKVKRLQNALKKLNKRRKYYESVLGSKEVATDAS